MRSWAEHQGVPALVEHAHGSYERPGLRGHRLSDPGGGPRDIAGRAWSTAFSPVRVEQDATTLVVEAQDIVSGLALRTEFEALPGGALRGRHLLTNVGRTPYLRRRARGRAAARRPAPIEVLDFTGRHERERTPQRHVGHATGSGCASHAAASPAWTRPAWWSRAPAGFGFYDGRAAAASTCRGAATACSACERERRGGADDQRGRAAAPRRDRADGRRRRYTMPWVFFAAADDGLDGLARPGTPGSDRCRRIRPCSRWRSTSGRPCTSTTTSNGCAASPTWPPGSASSASCSTTGGSAAAATTPPGLGDWWVDDERVAGRTDAARRPRPRPRHAVRALVRARDGQPGLRPLPRRTPTGSSPRTTGCRCCTAASWSST